MKKQSAISNRQSVIRQRAFTLTELLVVISVIALALTITLPSVISLFTAGADLQSRNVISSMMGAARGVAIGNQSYACVHVQIGTDGKCWAAVLQYDKDPSSASFGKFVPVDGFPPRRMPADMA
ncbi:MAG: type II secretion system protein, partial [Phycisphaerae bacterium]|nr:type II secretion system protein [Phycisphaerae bacterium]